MDDSIKNILNRLEITPNRSLSQNFSKNSQIAKNIIFEANIKPDETVLEIGPGLGILTDEIIKKTENLIIVEKDSRLIEYLKGRYKDKDVRIIEGDILEIKMPNFDKVVSNLPFNISKPITMNILKRDFKSSILTFQKEYISKIKARKGDVNYSLLSVVVSTFAEVELLFDIPKHEFFPPPKVNATVVKMIPKEPEFEIIDEEKYLVTVTELFNYRRKMIKNALKIAFGIEKEVPLGNKRVGNLTPKEISRLVNYLVEKEYM
ncbi:MAG: 16S rRNA (adenine(1518)-N(6)/adenine(1519)-N(6))-dimethyltransferase RsmA [Thermoplasmatota archaeon]